MMAFLTLVRSSWRESLIICLLGAFLVTSALLDAEKAEHEQYRAEVKAAAAAQAYMAALAKESQAENLRKIEEKHDEKHVQEIRSRARAVVADRVRNNHTGGGTMPGIAASQPADDGTREECAAAYAIVADAAEDADTLTMWQEWARLNKIPVRE